MRTMRANTQWHGAVARDRREGARLPDCNASKASRAPCPSRGRDRCTIGGLFRLGAPSRRLGISRTRRLGARISPDILPALSHIASGEMPSGSQPRRVSSPAFRGIRDVFWRNTLCSKSGGHRGFRPADETHQGAFADGNSCKPWSHRLGSRHETLSDEASRAWAVRVSNPFAVVSRSLSRSLHRSRTDIFPYFCTFFGENC